MWPCRVRRWPCALPRQREASRSIHCSGDGRHAESCCLASRASRQCRPCASCISASGDGVGVYRGSVDAPKDVPTPTRDVRIWAVLPNQKSGEGKSAVLAAAIGSKGNPTILQKKVAGPRKGKDLFEHRFRKRPSVCLHDAPESDMHTCRETCLMDLSSCLGETDRSEAIATDCGLPLKSL